MNLVNKLRQLTPAEQTALHNRITLKQQLLNIEEANEKSKGRNTTSQTNANYMLFANYLLLPLYRQIRESRWKGAA